MTEVGNFSNRNYELNLGQMFGRSITVMDPPEHRTYRALFQQAFVPSMLGGWREQLIPQIINGLIDQFVERGRAELISEFSLFFPFHFVMNLLDLPREDWQVFHRLAFAQTTIRYDYAHGIEAGRKLTQYVTDLIKLRRAHPPAEDDFMYVLANAQTNGERLPEIVLVSFFRQLMNAAGDTSYHGFSSLLSGLLRHPEQLAAVRADRALLPQAIEEGLRWEAPIVYTERTPHHELTLDGNSLAPGDHLFVAIGSANRDEALWDNPDRFDIFRKKQRVFSFGAGPHVCIGQHLARLEMNVALQALLDRLPNLRLDPNYPQPVVRGVSMRKPESIHVVWG
jgi:cytochrome P450